MTQTYVGNNSYAPNPGSMVLLNITYPTSGTVISKKLKFILPNNTVMYHDYSQAGTDGFYSNGNQLFPGSQYNSSVLHVWGSVDESWYFALTFI